MIAFIKCNVWSSKKWCELIRNLLPYLAIIYNSVQHKLKGGSTTKWKQIKNPPLSVAVFNSEAFSMPGEKGGNFHEFKIATATAEY